MTSPAVAKYPGSGSETPTKTFVFCDKYKDDIVSKVYDYGKRRLDKKPLNTDATVMLGLLGGHHVPGHGTHQGGGQ